MADQARPESTDSRSATVHAVAYRDAAFQLGLAGALPHLGVDRSATTRDDNHEIDPLGRLNQGQRRVASIPGPLIFISMSPEGTFESVKRPLASTGELMLVPTIDTVTPVSAAPADRATVALGALS